jgi:hypothetical protein
MIMKILKFLWPVQTGSFTVGSRTVFAFWLLIWNFVPNRQVSFQKNHLQQVPLWQRGIEGDFHSRKQNWLQVVDIVLNPP